MTTTEPTDAQRWRLRPLSPFTGRRFRSVEERRMEGNDAREGLTWQIGVWDRISDIYLREIDQRFAPVVENVIARAGLEPGHRVLDLGTGTGPVAERAAPVVSPAG